MPSSGRRMGVFMAVETTGSVGARTSARISLTSGWCSRERGRVGAGLRAGEHPPREPFNEFGAQFLGAGVVPEIGGLVRVFAAVVQLAPRDAVVDAEAMPRGHEAARADTAGEAEIRALALLLDQDLVAERFLAAADEGEQ